MYWQNHLNSPVLPLSRGVFGHLGDQILLYLTKIVPSVSAAELPLCQLLDLSIFLPLSLLFLHLVLCEHFRNTVHNPLIKIGWSKKSTDPCQYRQKEVGKDMFIKCLQPLRSTFILNINSWEMHPAWGSKERTALWKSECMCVIEILRMGFYTRFIHEDMRRQITLVTMTDCGKEKAFYSHLWEALLHFQYALYRFAAVGLHSGRWLLHAWKNKWGAGEENLSYPREKKCILSGSRACRKTWHWRSFPFSAKHWNIRRKKRE